jgi:hypothetical protein
VKAIPPPPSSPASSAASSPSSRASTRSAPCADRPQSSQRPRPRWPLARVAEAKLIVAASLLLLAGSIACSGHSGGTLLLDADDADSSADAADTDAADTDATTTDDTGSRPPPPDGQDASDAEGDASLPPPPTRCEVNADCDDLRFCNGTESCSEAGVCIPGAPIACDDAVACTHDLCDEGARRCLNIPDATACANNGYCHPTADCIPQPRCFDSVDCDDDAACTQDVCVNGECRYSPDDSLCDGGDFCVSPEVCAPFLGCIPGVARACDDADTCTLNTCDADAAMCVFLPRDDDRDGASSVGCGGLDCDDADPDAYPGAAESCDGVDNDCDGLLDEDAPFSARAPSPLAAASAHADASQPQRVALSTGHAAALWLTPSTRTLHLQVFAPDGAALAPLTFPNTASERPGAFAAAPTADGKLLLTRVTGSNGGPYDVSASLITPDSAAPAPLTLTTARAQAASLSVAAAADGSHWVAWQDSRAAAPFVYLSRLRPNHTLDAGADQIAFGTDFASATQPALTLTPTQQPILAWISPRSGDSLPTLTLAAPSASSPATPTPTVALDFSAGAAAFSLSTLGADVAVLWSESPTSTRTNLRITRLPLPLDAAAASEVPLLDPPGDASQLTLCGEGPFFSAAFLLSTASGKRPQWISIDPVSLSASPAISLHNQQTEHVSLSFDGSQLRALLTGTPSGALLLDSACQTPTTP